MLWKEFYVYVYRQRIDRQWVPFYVGKGQGDRAHVKKRRSAEFTALLAGLDQSGRRPRIDFEFFAEEAEAYRREVQLIAEFGRLDRGSGTLVNKTAGGEGMREIWFTDEMRAASAAQMVVLHANPAVQAKRIENLRSAAGRPSTKALRRAAMQRRYSLPSARAEHAAKMRAVWAEGKFREQHSKALSASWIDPVVRQKRMQGMAAAMADGGSVRRSCTMRALFQQGGSEARRQKIAEFIRDREADPSFKKKKGAAVKAALADPTTKLKHRAALYLIWARRHRDAGQESKADASEAKAQELMRQL